MEGIISQNSTNTQMYAGSEPSPFEIASAMGTGPAQAAVSAVAEVIDNIAAVASQNPITQLGSNLSRLGGVAIPPPLNSADFRSNANPYVEDRVLALSQNNEQVLEALSQRERARDAAIMESIQSTARRVDDSYPIRTGAPIQSGSSFGSVAKIALVVGGALLVLYLFNKYILNPKSDQGLLSSGGIPQNRSKMSDMISYAKESMMEAKDGIVGIVQ